MAGQFNNLSVQFEQAVFIKPDATDSYSRLNVILPTNFCLYRVEERII